MILDKQYENVLIHSDYLNETWVLQYYFGLMVGIFTLFIALIWMTHM